MSSEQQPKDQGPWWIKYVVQLAVALIGAGAVITAAIIGLRM